MVKSAASQSPSPVTITVTPCKGSGDRSLGLTSPIPRASVITNQNSPLSSRATRRTSISSGNRRSNGDEGRYCSMSVEDLTAETTNSECVLSYTVHIPPTPDHQTVFASQESEEDEMLKGNSNQKSFLSGTIFTGGFKSVTRGHVIDCSMDRADPEKKSGQICWLKGCDEKVVHGRCECGFRICRDCYFDCITSGGGNCPGCKEPYRDINDDPETEEEDEEDEAKPLPQMGESKLDKRLSVVKSFKAQNQAGDFDHTRWLFETKGTYGYGNAVWPKDGYGIGSGGGGNGYETPPEFGERSKRPLTRKVSVSAAIISPYRLLIALRLVALGLFLTWRVRHPNREAMWLWGMSTTCELWFALSWLLDQLPKLCPVNRLTDLGVLKERFESPNLRNPKGRSDLPGIDVFVSTADPEKEPPLVTANTILSILAVDYPVEKLACYLSDDGGALLTFEALAQTASFASTWVPFCRKHNIEPRNPEAYFGQKRNFLKNKVRLDFVRERRRVKREYDEFKVRINSLPEAIRRRSDAYNVHEELRAKKKQMEMMMGNNPQETVIVPKATWMSDGSHWPGTWSSGETDNSRGDHAGIIQAMLAPPNAEPVYGAEADAENLIDTTDVDIRLPMLVYVSREKRPGYDHNKKAGAMNALVRTSAIMSNGPFILNLDCDHYIYNSMALREGMCFMLDRGGDRICYVQFPQRFEGIDPNDRYANHNTVFFDVSMRALDGLQGPMYVGTGCIFRRTALYGFSPPRATEHHGWLGRRKVKISLRRPKAMMKKDDEVSLPINGEYNEEENDDGDIESLLLPKRFGNSNSFVASIPVAEYQGRLIQDLQGKGKNSRPAGSLAVPREPLDAATVAEAISVISCFYEDKTEWGKRVGWIYGSVTEDVVTGYRMHNRGWRSIYCVTKRDAFRGTAPINLTDRLHQVLRWATGSVEIFFSRNNAIFATRRMKFLQRVAYFNVGMYPFTSLFLIVYLKALKSFFLSSVLTTEIFFTGEIEKFSSKKLKMLQSKVFNKKTRGGRIQKQVREVYLRDDIYCGAFSCKSCDSSAARLSSSKIIVVDTNVVLHQIDLLENKAIDTVVVLSVVLDEVKNRNRSVYNRIRLLCSNPARQFYVFSNHVHKDTYVQAMEKESANDHNDRAIRVATLWYQKHLGDTSQVLLVTNDRENKRKATEEGISAETIEAYVKSLGQPELLDLLAQPTNEDITMEDADDSRPSKRKLIYQEHKPMSEITAGLHRGIYHQGKLRVNRFNPYEAYVGSESIGEEIIIYGRSNMNRAFDGDIVAVELLPRDQWQDEKALSIAEEDDEEDDTVHLAPDNVDDAPRTSNLSHETSGDKNAAPVRPSGRVVGVIRRNWHSYCGSLEPMSLPAGSGGTAHALFVSKDRRIPKIRINTRQLQNLLDMRIVVAVDSWDRQSRYPSGHYVRPIGKIGDKETETEVVLIENDVDYSPFSSQVLACLPPLPWSVSSEDVSNPVRQDLRHLLVFSVDPPGCKDIDDALHCTSLPNGNFELGVHIADVTNFVHPGTPLDDEASKRGTSVYLVERRIDMLPKPLTEDICSLRADVERLAFSVIWEMSPDAEIISTRFTKSIIKSSAALSYIEAQARMDDSRLTDSLTTDLRNMNTLAKIMRQRRIDRGALTLASAEVKFDIDPENHDPLNIGMYQILEANQMVEEFMLAANVSVAGQILKLFPSCSLLRRHPTPTREMLEPLLRTAAAIGLTLDVSSSKALADSLDRAVGEDPYFNKLIRILATRCMTQAVYFCSGDLSPPEYHHYGLAAPLYTHFTSPIRRYADVFVHRLLAASLGIYKLPTVFQDRPQLTSVADNLNYRHRNAQMAGRASVELYVLIYFRTRPTDEEARVVKIRSNGFIVFVPKYGIEGPVYLTGKGEKGAGDWYVDEEKQKIVKMDGSLSYSVLQTVKIHMEVVEPQPNRPKLQLTLL